MAAGRGEKESPRVLPSLPVLSVAALMAFLYYATVFHLLELDTHRGRLHAAAFSFLAYMSLCSFASAVLADPGRVPSSFAPDTEDRQGGLKYCDKCNTYKPSRAHHCRVCKRCTLKMDHHCLWINNCVGHRNYKLFIIFVFYATSASVYSMVIFLSDLFWEDHDFTGKLPLKILYICMGLIVIPLSLVLASLLGWHIFLISRNMTTIEYRGSVRAMWLAKKSGQPYHHPFDIGPYRNISAVFGSNILKWFCPCPTGDLKDGTQFPSYEDA